MVGVLFRLPTLNRCVAPSKWKTLACGTAVATNRRWIVLQIAVLQRNCCRGQLWSESIHARELVTTNTKLVPKARYMLPPPQSLSHLHPDVKITLPASSALINMQPVTMWNKLAPTDCGWLEDFEFWGLSSVACYAGPCNQTSQRVAA